MRNNEVTDKELSTKPLSAVKILSYIYPDLESALLEHLVEVVDPGGGLLGHTLDAGQQLRVLQHGGASRYIIQLATNQQASYHAYQQLGKKEIGTGQCCRFGSGIGCLYDHWIPDPG